MKNLILIFFLINSISFYSQFNVDSISYYMFEIMNEERDKLGITKRYRSIKCKKAAEWHLNYLMKYNSISTEGHLEYNTLSGNKILKTPGDRYRYYEKDSSRVCSDSIDSESSSLCSCT
jgi:hypothetical protein